MKDTNNILDHNQWSADYDETPNAFICGSGMKVYVTNEYSSIGESSFKIVKTGTTQVWVEVRQTSNKTSFTGTIDVYNPYENGALILVISYSDNSQSSTNVGIPFNDDLQTISASINAVSGKTVSTVALRVSLNNAYVDNLRLAL
ncbi:hypothetical protein [uncultured Methanobrevibacter sp.]|uniref:hypothetical protein n=1 Tax=uncultured Methanobrevibacter sp. TaxID=253161 RepID=UPI0025EB3C98|nr:hypothetical protein [uncultured Methanobrevibacter sp.]